LRRANIAAVRQIDLTADGLVDRLLGASEECQPCILDSCGVTHLGSHLLMSGVDPVETIELRGPDSALSQFESFLSLDLPVMFTLSYELGMSLNGIPTRHRTSSPEPYIMAAAFDALAVHDYASGETTLRGQRNAVDRLAETLARPPISEDDAWAGSVTSDGFTREAYISAILAIQELIRDGDTYQTNLTRRISAALPPGLTPEQIFSRLRKRHPAPFAAFIKRKDSAVISASPERFFRIEDGVISTSPIKGTRPRGATPAEDARLRSELLNSAKDRAENTMIVDLLRNDLGRVCEFGSVYVERICELEEHPSLFHLVSTISGQLCERTSISDIIRALLPCGSITGAPKISTMKIIDEIEPVPRGLSMGAVGVYMPGSFGFGEFLDTSVAIRTMVVRGRSAEFNVGGGIVIDSDPHSEYEETVTKSLALLSALGTI
jgi:para-aminobenzoate synthetase component I